MRSYRLTFVIWRRRRLDAESRAEAERKDVELDQSFQDRESSVSSRETHLASLV